MRLGGKEYTARQSEFLFCYSRVDTVDAQILSCMKTAGFEAIVFGVESFSDKTIADMDKKIRCGPGSTPRMVALEAIRQTAQAGLTAMVNLILCYPSVTLEDIQATIDTATELFMQDNVLVFVSFMLFAFPGAKIMQKGYKIVQVYSIVNGEGIAVPWIVLPEDMRVRGIVNKAQSSGLDFVENQIKQLYGWAGKLPLSVVYLALCKAIYLEAGLDYGRIDEAVALFMRRAKEHIIAGQLSIGDGGKVSYNKFVWELFEHKIVSLRREKAEGYVYGLEAKYGQKIVGTLKFVLLLYEPEKAEITEIVFWKDAGIVGPGFGKKAWECALNKVVSCNRYRGVYRFKGQLPSCAFSDNLKLFTCLGFNMVNLRESKSDDGLLIKRKVSLVRNIEGGDLIAYLDWLKQFNHFILCGDIFEQAALLANEYGDTEKIEEIIMLINGGRNKKAEDVSPDVLGCDYYNTERSLKDHVSEKSRDGGKRFYFGLTNSIFSSYAGWSRPEELRNQRPCDCIESSYGNALLSGPLVLLTQDTAIGCGNVNDLAAWCL